MLLYIKKFEKSTVYKYQMTCQHQNSHLRNQTLLWHGTDREELYQHNLINNLEMLQHHNWIDCPITYKFNSYGFRSDEFNSGELGVMFIGCSHTVGIGLPLESTWPYIVSTSLKLKNYNLGIGGASNDTAFRLAYYWIDRLRPSVVIFLSTERTRAELHTIDNKVEGLSVQYIQNQLFPDATPFMRHWVSNDINSDMNYLKNTLAVKQLCDTRGIKYVQEEALNVHELDKARDLQHYGRRTNRCIASMILSRV
jgi:hypothetical protein